MSFLEKFTPMDGEVLEVGCGKGSLFKHDRLTSPSANITALDISEIAINAARMNHEGIEFQVGDILTQNIGKEYDHIVDSHLFYFFTDLKTVEKYLFSIHNLLKDDGKFYLETMVWTKDMKGFDFDEDGVILKDDKPFKWAMRARELEAVFLNNQFKIEYLMINGGLRMIPFDERAYALPTDPEVARLVVTKF